MLPFRSLLFLMLVGIFLQACQETPEKVKITVDADAPLFTKLNPADTGIDFQNTSIESRDRHLGFYDYFYNGSGVAIGDFNNDGLNDVFFAGNDAPNKLYINEGDFKFKDVSKKAGIGL